MRWCYTKKASLNLNPDKCRKLIRFVPSFPKISRIIIYNFLRNFAKRNRDKRCNNSPSFAKVVTKPSMYALKQRFIMVFLLIRKFFGTVFSFNEYAFTNTTFHSGYILVICYYRLYCYFVYPESTCVQCRPTSCNCTLSHILL